MEEGKKLAHGTESAARVLGVSKRTIYSLLERGELSSFTVGARRLISQAELERFVREREAAV